MDDGTVQRVRVAVAGATGWAGSLVARAILASSDLRLTAAVARKAAGQDLGVALGGASVGVTVVPTLDEALAAGVDVVVDYTKPDSVKERTLAAIRAGVRVVIGTSGLTAADYAEIEAAATKRGVGVIAAGNFSITAALAKHFALVAAKHVPSFELIDYASASKVDVPSGTVRELAEALGEVRKSELGVALEKLHGPRETRGATIGGAQVHSVRLPGYVIAFEAQFGLPNERLTIRHDAGNGAEPYVAGTLLAVRKVMTTTGLVRGLDRFLL